MVQQYKQSIEQARASIEQARTELVAYCENGLKELQGRLMHVNLGHGYYVEHKEGGYFLTHKRTVLTHTRKFEQNHNEKLNSNQRSLYYVGGSTLLVMETVESGPEALPFDALTLDELVHAAFQIENVSSRK